MKDYAEKYRKIIGQIVNKSFPLLKDRKIRVYESSKVSFSADTLSVLWFSRIRCPPKIRKLSKRALEGLFTHELCHIEIYCKRGYLIGFFCQFPESDNAAVKEEHLMDYTTIDKGYGKGLYEQRVWRYKRKDKNFHKFKHRYLSPDEILDYMKSKKPFLSKKRL